LRASPTPAIHFLLPHAGFHPAMGRAYEREQSPSARDAIAQILTNSRMCAEGHRPLCQDTGIVVVFVKVGMGVRWDATLDLEAMINEGVRRAYLDPDNKLRASIVSDPAFKRANTRDNTPAVIHTELVPGETSRSRSPRRAAAPRTSRCSPC
jgi:fumarate hydratase class I